MSTDDHARRLLTSTSIQEYFQHSITDALQNQQIEATCDTVSYVVNLLTTFARSEALYDQTEDGLRLRPLALLYADAVYGQSAKERQQALRRLGDVALFIAGVFADSLNRKLVDVDYYIAMGGNAYGYLAEHPRDPLFGSGHSRVFSELASKFTDFVDVLAEVSDRSQMRDSQNIMRLYEVWLRTGSHRAARRLRALGIEPNVASRTTKHH